MRPSCARPRLPRTQCGNPLVGGIDHAREARVRDDSEHSPRGRRRLASALEVLVDHERLGLPDQSEDELPFLGERLRLLARAPQLRDRLALARSELCIPSGGQLQPPRSRHRVFGPEQPDDRAHGVHVRAARAGPGHQWRERGEVDPVPAPDSGRDWAQSGIARTSAAYVANALIRSVLPNASHALAPCPPLVRLILRT